MTNSVSPANKAGPADRSAMRASGTSLARISQTFARTTCLNGASLADLMARMGHASMDAALRYQRLRRERGLGVSQAVNELVRRGLLPRPTERRFRQRTAQLGLRVDVSNVAEALDALEGPTSR